MLIAPWTIARSPAEVQDLFFRQRWLDTLGHTVHVCCAIVACLLAGAPTSVVEWAMLPVLLCTLVRMTAHHRVLRPLWLDPVAIGVLLFAIWMFASALWSGASMRSGTSTTSGGAGGWLGDVQALRFTMVLLLLWPTLDRRNWLIAALALGLAAGQVSQLLHLVGISAKIAALDYHRMPGRISGWWDPVIAGSLLCAALGLHLGGLLFSRRGDARSGILGVFGTISTIACIAATGSRGAWLAAGALIVVAMGLAISRVRPRSAAFMVLAAAVAIGVASAFSINTIANDGPRQRLLDGMREVRSALESGDTNSDTGNRIAMASWAWCAFQAHPIVGVGAGGFMPWITSRSVEDCRHLGMNPDTRARVHAHAHNWPLHILAIAGGVGLLLLAIPITCAIWSGLCGPRLSAAGKDSLESGYAIGPALALIGLVFAGMFDPISTNAQTSYVFFVLLALCLPMRPAPIRLGTTR